MQMFTQPCGLYSMDEAQEAHWKRFGAYLRDAMAEQGLTATECAKRSGMTLTQWSRLLNGASGTRRTTIAQLVRALGWTNPDRIEDLYRRAGFVPPPIEDRSPGRKQPIETREPEPDADLPEVLKWYEGLPPDDRAKAREYIQLLRQKYRGRDPRDEE